MTLTSSDKGEPCTLSVNWKGKRLPAEERGATPPPPLLWMHQQASSYFKSRLSLYVSLSPSLFLFISLKGQDTEEAAPQSPLHHSNLWRQTTVKHPVTASVWNKVFPVRERGKRGWNTHHSVHHRPLYWSFSWFFSWSCCISEAVLKFKVLNKGCMELLWAEDLQWFSCNHQDQVSTWFWVMFWLAPEQEKKH